MNFLVCTCFIKNFRINRCLRYSIGHCNEDTIASRPPKSLAARLFLHQLVQERHKQTWNVCIIGAFRGWFVDSHFKVSAMQKAFQCLKIFMIWLWASRTSWSGITYFVSISSHKRWIISYCIKHFSNNTSLISYSLYIHKQPSRLEYMAVFVHRVNKQRGLPWLRTTLSYLLQMLASCFAYSLSPKISFFVVVIRIFAVLIQG